MITTTFPGGLGLNIDKFFYDKLTNTHEAPKYPPYNVIQMDDDEWELQFAVAGFTKDAIEISTHKNVLTIQGHAEEQVYPEGAKVLYKGIATRKFIRTFNLPEHTEVLQAVVRDGILYVDLVRVIPEDKKPKTITIK